jgi:hypothetical protein
MSVSCEPSFPTVISPTPPGVCRQGNKKQGSSRKGGCKLRRLLFNYRSKLHSSTLRPSRCQGPPDLSFPAALINASCLKTVCRPSDAGQYEMRSFTRTTLERDRLMEAMRMCGWSWQEGDLPGGTTKVTSRTYVSSGTPMSYSGKRGSVLTLNGVRPKKTKGSSQDVFALALG